MTTRRIPLVGSLSNRNPNPGSFLTKDQIFTNCYPEIQKNPVTGTSRVYLNKRPGMSQSAVVTTTVNNGSYGCCLWSSSSSSASPSVFSFAGSALAKIFRQDVTQVGADISNVNTCYFLNDTSVNGVGTLTGIFADSGTGAKEGWYFPEGGSWTQITDSDFPTNLTPYIAHMDGYMFVMGTDGKVTNSDLNSVSTYTAGAYITAQSMPDGGIGVARYKNTIVAIGKYSVEFFRNAGNPTGSVLVPVKDALIRIGGIDQGGARTIFTYGDTVYWIGINPESGARGVYRLNGSQAEKVSNPYIDKRLSEDTIQGFSGAFNSHGMSHILMATGSQSAPAYCVDTNTWWNFQTFGDGGSGPVLQAVVGSIVGADSAANYFSDTNIGSNRIYTMDAAVPVYQDATSTYRMLVRTETIDFGTDRKKFYQKFKIIGDRQTTNSPVSVAYSDDDYATSTSAGTIQMSSTVNVLTRLGSSKRRAWYLEHTTTTPFRAEAIELDFEVGEA